MALKHSDYQKLLKLSDYTCMVSGPAANAECTRIYTTVSAIDFAHYVDECNKLYEEWLDQTSNEEHKMRQTEKLKEDTKALNVARRSLKSDKRKKEPEEVIQGTY